MITVGLFGLLLAVVSLSCSKETETKTAEPGPAEYLAESFETGHKRSSEVLTFVGQDLYELINGGAEVYRLYQFVDVANAYYKLGETEITADVYRFSNADMAYGLFSTLRPTDPETASLGVESFKSPMSVRFVKGQFMVRVTGFEPDDATANATLKLAQAIEQNIKGTTTLPALFRLLPEQNRIRHTEKVIAMNFMGRSGVTEVYSQDYFIDDETITFFIAEDLSGGKFAAWKTALESGGGLLKPAEFGYDENYSFITTSSFYGDIVVGLKNGRLCGLVGYQEKHEQVLIDWLGTL